MCTWKVYANNSALGCHRAVPKVANQRYCNIVLIFLVFFVHMHMQCVQCMCTWKEHTKKNSALGGKTAFQKVANKRYCNSFYFLHFYLCKYFCACSMRMQKAHTNNSAPGHHRVVPKVANERHSNIVLIWAFLCTCMHSTRSVCTHKRCIVKKTQFWVVTECSRRWQMKGIAI